MFTGADFESVWMNATTSSDRADIREYARLIARVHRLTDDQIFEVVAAQRRAAHEVISANRDLVEAVARALAAERVLSSNRVAELVADTHNTESSR